MSGEQISSADAALEPVGPGLGGWLSEDFMTWTPRPSPDCAELVLSTAGDQGVDSGIWEGFWARPG